MAPVPSGKLLPANALDARPASEFQAQPTAEAPNIPVAELAGRVYELPPLGITVKLYRTGAEADEAAEFLTATGRDVEFVQPAYDPPTKNRYRLWAAPEFLVEKVKPLSPGRALCLACGVGREAVHLAALGWQVVAIDWLPDALARGRLLAERYLPSGCPKIEWIQADLRQPLPDDLGRFDLVCELFSWQDATPAHFAAALSPSGVGLWETFADRKEATSEWPKLEVVGASTGWRELRKTRRLLLTPDETEIGRD